MGGTQTQTDTHTQTDRQTLASSIFKFFKVVSDFENKKRQGTNNSSVTIKVLGNVTDIHTDRHTHRLGPRLS